MGDIIAISGLAVKVYTAYKDAPDDYKHISEEVVALKILVDKVAQHFRSTNMSRHKSPVYRFEKALQKNDRVYYIETEGTLSY